ncbi:hypothetical protein [Sulfurovum sp.]
MPNKPKESNQKPAGGFLIGHFKRYVSTYLPETKKEDNCKCI